MYLLAICMSSLEKRLFRSLAPNWVICHVIYKQRTFYFFFLIWMPFVLFFSCLFALTRITGTILNKSDESGVGMLVLFLILEEKLSVFIIEYDVSCELVIYGLYYVEVIYIYT